MHIFPFNLRQFLGRIGYLISLVLLLLLLLLLSVTFSVELPGNTYNFPSEVETII
jgi:hypothetical protein